MKKILLLSIVLLGAFTSYAQKLQYTVFHHPYYRAPINQDYANYKSYGLHVFSTNENMNLFEGEYSLSNVELTRDDVNGDMKILIRVTEWTNAAFSINADTAFLKVQSITANVMAFDKSGNKFYSKTLRRDGSKAQLLGYKNKKKLEEYDRATLAREVMESCIGSFTYDLVGRYMLSTRRSEYSDSPLIADFFTAYNRKSVAALEVNDYVAALLSAETPGELRATAKKQIRYWQNLAELPESKENANFIICGNYNLAVIYAMLGDMAESDKYAAACTKASKYGRNALEKRRNLLAERLVDPAINGPFVDMDPSPSKFTMADAIENALYYIIPETAYITLKDGGYVDGKCKISRTSINEYKGSNVVTLDPDNFMVTVFVETENKNINFRLSEVKEIKAGSDLYVGLRTASQNTLQKRIINDKMSLYEQVIPGNGGLYYYQKAGGDLENAPSISANSWYRKFFADTPALAEQIVNKQVTNPVEITKLYNAEVK